MGEDFKVLSLREEEALSESEIIEYYARLREHVLQRKLQTTTRGALTVAPKLKKWVNKLDTWATNILAGGKAECVTDGIENIPEGPVLFANTHQGILDNCCWIPSNPRHCVVLHTSDASKFLVFIQLCTGLILVNKNDKKDKRNRTNAKLDMINILLNGHSVMYYPEGAWNLSPNKLHLPMSYGFLEVAKKAGVPVVPVVTEFTHDVSNDRGRVTKIHIRYGKPIYVSLTDDLSSKLSEYEEAISTIRWELIEEKHLFKRGTLSNWDYINYIKGVFRSLELKNPKLGAKAMNDIERRSIRGANSDYYLFHHINDIPFDENGNLLETEEVRRLDALERENKAKRIVCNVRSM